MSKNLNTIIIPTQYFSPEIFQINDLCTWLSHRYKVIVIAPQPSYPSRKDIDKKNSKAFNKNVKIIRLPVFKRDGSLFGFFLNQITFLLTSIPITVFYTIFKNPKYIVVPQYSPFTCILPAFFASFFNKSELIIWVFDLWPESIRLFRKNKIYFDVFYKLLIKITNFILSRFHKILISSPKFRYADSLKSSKNIINLNSWEPQNKAFANKIIVNKPKEIIISSVGNIGNAHDINLIKQFLIVADKLEIKINFAGGGSKLSLLKEFVLNENINNVFFHNYISKDKAKDLISNSHFSLIPFKKSEISDTIPYRFVTSIAFSTPLLSFNETYISKIIKKNEIGICFDNKLNKFSFEENFSLLEKFIYDLYQLDFKMLSSNAANFFDKNYSYESSDKRLTKIFN